MNRLKTLFGNRMVQIALLVLAGYCLAEVSAAGTEQKVKPRKYPRGVRVLRMNSEMVAPIRIRTGKTTVLNFPLKPSKVILGAPGSFAIEYVENDLAIAALTPGASSNLFVYLEGRRFAFDLSQVASDGDAIVLVRDEEDRK